ncbi:uncharacterized protein N7477_003991 [Penicillium maclennaniae]|uniref:uncharacterized protein n=1 Tax=Penicillium maclennaniae TaxID=1343394 RepID=UPI00254194DF|nr:uncharacterized protein N7477_003991 [Penicillium maclennaniae]KAJ5678358.1 hypothetical protein N7477_003991 [Penicillium maclennaniae]
MAGSCEVCSLEPSKYRCPTCAVMSCSLACTQSHKIYCAPKAAPAHETPDVPATTETISPLQNGDHTQEAVNHETNQYQSFPGSMATFQDLKELLLRHPQLRDQLHEIYRGTQEDQWVEWYTPPTRGRGHGRGGRAPTRRSRGHWTAEKGFNRGLGRVRKLRQDCEEGTETGPNAEAFMQFLALVHGHQEQLEQQHAT